MVTLYKREDHEDKTSGLSTPLGKVLVDKFEEEVNLTVSEEAETCTTPTAKEHRIPDVVTCPPAPRKRKASFLSIKNVSNKKSKKVDKLFVFSDIDPMPGLHQISCNKIPWRSKKKFH
ncbi:hypothetical protein Pint_00744 [Pistacia integerrima]|uniref:Uncharacterized protein n=1 Tax=Pistacia integerrima TaxID=434235 RepID=A0ACC0ZNL0_9ROSI|nr:hypothetical protein Pint_00744 [Pistacia integerrima]